MLEARSLTKYYSHTPAVRGVSFTIRPGEILGYLGPNGAGKSTTVKMLTGLIEPSEGQIFYRGRTVYDDFTAFQRRIGYVPEEPHLYPHLTGREYLQLVGRLRGMPRRTIEPKMDEFLRLFGLWDDRHSPLASYSKGMRQKILLSAALLHDPEILILDEPFSGLDVTSALVVRRLMRALAERGKMILYSSHVLEVVEKVCSNVLILRKGEVVAYDSISRLQELMSQPSLEGVFAQLAEVEDSDTLANQIMEAMRYEGTGSALPRTPPSDGAPPATAAKPVELPPPPTSGVSGRLLSETVQDIRYGLRSLAGAPGFTAVALLSLTLGIGVATSAFSELSGFIMRDVPGVGRPGELVTVKGAVSYPNYKRYRAVGDLFSGTMAYMAPVPFGVSTSGRTERVWGHLVTASYFPTLGVQPLLGRFFSADEEQPGRAPQVVVSHRFWRDQLGSNPSVVGKAMRINGQPCTIVGVGPPGFLGASPLAYGADLWLPVSVDARTAPEVAGDALDRRDLAVFQVIGRLKPGVAPARAEAALDAVARQLEQEYGDPDKDRPGQRIALLPGGKLVPVRKEDLPFLTGFFAILGGMILLIASSNVANMMLARSADRRREIAVRLALGAGRFRLLRQLLTESLLVALGAGVLGFLMAVWVMHLASREKMIMPMPVSIDLAPDGRVLLFTLALTVFTALAFGLLPAWRATRTDLTPALKEGGNVRFSRFRYLSFRNLLMLSQVAASLMLLLITGFLVIGHERIAGGELGFDPRRLYTISLDPVRDGYSGARTTDFFNKLLDRVKMLPAIGAASLASSVPMTMFGQPNANIYVPGPGDTKARTWGRRYVVGRDFFGTMGIPILRGRGFRKEDETDDSTTAIVSEKMAQQCWKGKDPLGRRIEIGNEGIPTFVMGAGGPASRNPRSSERTRSFEVVGVARNVRDGLNLVAADAPPVIYLPARPSDFAHPSRQGVILLVRGAPGADAIGAVVREIAAMDDKVTPFSARGLPEQIEEMLFPVWVALYTYGFIGVFGLILAAVGLAGVTAYSVTQRRREIGIRIALGAQKTDVLGLVMKEGAVLIAIGSVLGLAGARAGIRGLSAVMSQIARTAGTSTSDPMLLVGAPVLLAALALVACYVPARRSTRVDPAVTLRQE